MKNKKKSGNCYTYEVPILFSLRRNIFEACLSFLLWSIAQSSLSQSVNDWKVRTKYSNSTHAQVLVQFLLYFRGITSIPWPSWLYQLWKYPEGPPPPGNLGRDDFLCEIPYPRGQIIV